jgi:hypothetical protein
VVNINQTVGDIATVSMLQRSNEQLVRQIQGSMLRSSASTGAHWHEPDHTAQHSSRCSALQP